VTDPVDQILEKPSPGVVFMRLVQSGIQEFVCYGVSQLLSFLDGKRQFRNAGKPRKQVRSMLADNLE